jgi:hypothetical protein
MPPGGAQTPAAKPDAKTTAAKPAPQPGAPSAKTGHDGKPAPSVASPKTAHDEKAAQPKKPAETRATQKVPEAAQAPAAEQPAAIPSQPAATAVAPAPEQATEKPKTEDTEVEGSFKIKGLGFNGTIKFDGNPMSLIQAPTAPQPPTSEPNYPAASGQPPAMQQFPPPTQAFSSPAQMPPVPQLTPADIGNAARALENGVMRAAPRLGIPVDPRLLNQGSGLLQQVFTGGNHSSALEVHERAGQEAPAAILNQLSALVQSSQYNGEMAEEAVRLSSFGEPSMRLTAAMEAQRNAAEARAAAERAVELTGTYNGKALELSLTVKAAAERAQAFANQAQANAAANSPVAP